MSKFHSAGPMDYLFLYAETAQQPMHVGCLLTYRVPDTPEQDKDQVRAMLTGMLKHTAVIPPFNYRLVKRRGLPHWQEESDVDLSQHVHHVHLPEGSGQAALLDMVGTLHARPMDRSKPLWRAWVISGLKDGRYAVYWQMHHALIDGISGIRMVVGAHSSDPQARNLKPVWAPDRARNRLSALTENAIDAAPKRTNWLSAIRTMLGTPATVGRGLWNNWLHERAAPYQGGLFHAPDSHINGRISEARRLVTGDFDLPRIKRLAKQLDGTVNDVLLVTVGRALHHYMRETGELPEGPLRCLIPVNLREGSSIGGNEFAMVRICMGTHRSTVRELISDVQASVAQQKNLLSNLANEARQLYTVTLLTPMLGHVATGKLSRFRTANTVISNIPGAAEKLYWNGCEVESMYPVSITLNECALNITVLSYRDRLELGLVGCPARVPGLQLLMNYLHEALAEIEGELHQKFESAPAAQSRESTALQEEEARVA